MIPILDLKAQYESIKDEINAAIARKELMKILHIVGARPVEQSIATASMWPSTLFHRARPHLSRGAGKHGSQGAEGWMSGTSLSRCALWKRDL